MLYSPEISYNLQTVKKSNSEIKIIITIFSKTIANKALLKVNSDGNIKIN